MVVTTMLGAIMTARLYAMYHRSRNMLIFLVAIVLAIDITCAVIISKVDSMVSSEELILSGTYQCAFNVEGNIEILIALVWILTAVWEVLALCLSLWMAVKYFHDSRQLQQSTIVEVLVKSHAVYFASVAAISCLQIGFLSPVIADSDSMFVIGPRLILSVREHYAKIVADPDTATCMTSVAFQQRVHVSTSSGV